MKKDLSTEFSHRQYMEDERYEIFYYNDTDLKYVSPHKHNYYECYFFLEGDIEYMVEEEKILLKSGDFLLIPPGIEHWSVARSTDRPYRRIVFWLSSPLMKQLVHIYPDLDYCFQLATRQQCCHFREDYIVSQEIHWKLLGLLEEIHNQHAFSETTRQIKIADFLSFINRLLFSKETSPTEKPLYLRICDFIDVHLSENLSLDRLASVFYVSKYHIAHHFNDEMGLSVHQYILKKRLQKIKEGLPSKIPLLELASSYGFSDYTSFYRAFKKEFHASPAAYRKQVQSIDNYKIPE
ncbi:AraC family transcriptional regulator [Candidatus Enterococcus clewellii]|uniref:HTH araC/xylS-type domain-containing protein n=1 Tax=Candidatus Enterococcus clewellii TaxID=1834193 RepID=A0A242KAQ1_9ENTE|nr:AraC family transcriptional regulator [Enterococcus sp. 9E7_DIV0242]OTP17620.1 hypothetical protein A5888_001758 [Enterococcus sp. 9E7_DIV0242]